MPQERTFHSPFLELEDLTEADFMSNVVRGMLGDAGVPGEDAHLIRTTSAGIDGTTRRRVSKGHAGPCSSITEARP